jgi:hypothetical protein
VELRIPARRLEHARGFALQLANLARDRFELRTRNRSKRGICLLDLARDVDQIVSRRHARQWKR